MHAVARRTQEERSASTKGRLLDATIDCLFDLGYAKTTTTEIAKRAGLSRGAQLHHFPTKVELVTTAVDHLFTRRTEEFRVAFETLPGEANKASAAIDLLWSIVSGPTFFAWLELMVAARTDPELRATVSAMAARFTETVERTFSEFFPRPAGAGPLHDIAPQFAFDLLQGLALEGIAQRERIQGQRVVEVLKVLAPLSIPPTK